uniref:hypothetical protein n=1 Tax=Herbidospora sakaeratensis TaxID=564415 RepID=UPI00078048A7|nr:hypothetical protein [Herbidospora sakaeratensis]
MFAFHLRGMHPGWLVFTGAVLGLALWIGFGGGGATEIGADFGTWGLARLYAVCVPVLLFVLTPLLERVWGVTGLRRTWRLAQLGGGRAAVDGLAGFLAGYAVYAAVVLVLAGYALVRMGLDAPSVGTVAVVTAAGPLAGGFLVLASGQLAAMWLSTPAARFAVVVLLVVLDATNQLPAAALSVSGTSLLAEGAGVWGPPLVGAEPPAAVVSVDGAFAATRVALGTALLAVMAVGCARRAPRE